MLTAQPMTLHCVALLVYSEKCVMQSSLNVKLKKYICFKVSCACLVNGEIDVVHTCTLDEIWWCCQFHLVYIHHYLSYQVNLQRVEVFKCFLLLIHNT